MSAVIAVVAISLAPKWRPRNGRPINMEKDPPHHVARAFRPATTKKKPAPNRGRHHKRKSLAWFMRKPVRFRAAGAEGARRGADPFPMPPLLPPPGAPLRRRPTASCRDPG